ncbi:hypothetical protein GALMADRAFT_519146 [Galerina marginata CBS 339.88]|uniref:Uncharacterized protein n=1 Tax=Galerina marginata (strain CBS 339.88) TaxID=685588 RepID=A0A067T508_GALM3|nr:hypothetical protein GALMADRAFT_519146 [Galerina marginata CBS 339.88]
MMVTWVMRITCRRSWLCAGSNEVYVVPLAVLGSLASPRHRPVYSRSNNTFIPPTSSPTMRLPWAHVRHRLRLLCRHLYRLQISLINCRCSKCRSIH